MKRFLFSSLLFFLALSTLQAEDRWVSYGPYGGRVDDFSVVQSSLIFANAGISLFRSTDHGVNWQRLTESGSLRFHSKAADRILSISDDRISMTTDRGLTWNAIFDDDIFFLDVQFEPQDPMLLSAVGDYGTASGNSLFGYLRSTDGGSSWHAMDASGLPARFQTSAMLVIDPSQGKRQYVLIGGYRILRTLDGGKKWTPVFSRPDSMAIKDLVIDPRNSLNLYAAGWDGIFTSTNGGDSWSSSRCNCHVEQIAIDPFDSSHLAAAVRGQRGNGKAKTSYDSGITWFDMPLPVTQGYLSVTFDAFHKGTMLVGSISAGVFRTTNFGNSFAPSNHGLDELNCADVTHEPVNEAHLLSVCDVGLFESTNAGNSWSKRNLPFPGKPSKIRIHPGDTRSWLLRLPRRIAISQDAGTTWEVRTIARSHFLAWDPGNSKILYISPAPGTVLKSTNLGISWQNTGTGLPASTIYTLEVSPSNSNILYLGTEMRRIFASTDAGKSWFERSNGISNLGRIYQIVLHPKDPNLVYAIGEWVLDLEEFPVLFKSTDSGGTWTRIGWNPGSSYPFISPGKIVLNPSASAEIFAECATRIVFSGDGGNTWEAISNSGLENHSSIYFLDTDYGSQSNRLTVGTNQGVFSRILVR